MGKISDFYKKIFHKIKLKKNLDKIKVEFRNLDDLFNHFGSDKGSVVSKIHGRDPRVGKYTGHGYHKFYEKYLNKIKDKNFNLLEIGTYKGASIASFYFYFKKANIFGIDKSLKFQFKSSRVKFFHCDTTKEKDLKKFEIFLKNNNCKFFDLIIDDGSHLLSDIKKNFLFFFEYLNPGGYYVIEDYNHPKYYEYANDIQNNEQLISDFLISLKEKKIFSSEISNFNSDNKLFDRVSNVHVHKGSMVLDREMLVAQDAAVSEKAIKELSNINVSDIAFIRKKL